MTSRERMIRMYDRALVSANYRRYFEDSGFYNFGYWDSGAKSQREASEALVDELVGRISNRAGRILDVACGPGASTRRLLRYYAPDQVTGINISENQLAAARERAPGCTFLLMDAAQLGFADDQFDAVMCVEAAFHFNTRERFLREVLRVLKPGGSLVLTDMLFRGFLKPIGDFGQVPPANFVQNIADYGTRLEAAGFESVEVEDATERCLAGFRRAPRPLARGRTAAWTNDTWTIPFDVRAQRRDCPIFSNDLQSLSDCVGEKTACRDSGLTYC